MACLPLHGLAVADLSEEPAGRYCAYLLGQAGAAVHRIVRDDFRPRGATEARVFKALDDYVASSTIVSGPHATGALARRSELIVESAWTSKRLVFGSGAGRFLELEQAYLVSVTPHGLTGTHANALADDITIQARGGWMYFNGRPDGDPLKAPGNLASAVAGGVVAATAALAHVLGRVPVHLDVAVVESVLATNRYQETVYSAKGEMPTRVGSGYSSLNRIARCRDGWVALAIATQSHWELACALMHLDHLLLDERLTSPLDRRANSEYIGACIDGWLVQHDRDEIVSAAQAMNIPIGPVLPPSEVPDSPPMLAREVFTPTIDGRGVRPGRIGITSRCGASPESVAVVRTPAPQTAPREAPGERGRPLKRYRIVEVGGWWAGPVVGRIFGLLGADVIKVESPTRPDPWRFHLCDESVDPVYESSPLFLSANVGKRSLSLDIARPDGRDILDRLLSSADALVQNLSPRAARGLELTTPRRDDQYPRLVRTSVSGFGQTGPWRDHLSFAVIGDSAAGIIDGLRYHPDSEPLFQGSITGDSVAGYHATFLTLAALYARGHHGGLGQDVDVSQAEALLNFSLESLVDLQDEGAARVYGNRHLDYSPFGVLNTGSHQEHLAISGISNVLTNPDIRQPASSHQRGAKLEERLSARGIAASRVLNPRDLLADEGFTGRQTHANLDHPLMGTLPYVGLGARATDHAFIPTRRAPTFGEHTREILNELGISPAKVTELEEALLTSDRPLSEPPKVGG
jgi:crotonobetainyl-CoA:carnitine CoA-transferase CaiB-like acyl-CoA transferase